MGDVYEQIEDLLNREVQRVENRRQAELDHHATVMAALDQEAEKANAVLAQLDELRDQAESPVPAPTAPMALPIDAAQASEQAAVETPAGQYVSNRGL